MRQQKNIFLFGAGAMLDWAAPSTGSLTELVRKSGFFISSSDVTVTEFIYQLLQEEGKYPVSEINFETIINVIEELIVYYSNFNAKKKICSLSRLLFISKYEKDLLNFSIEGGIAKHGFKLEIPKGKRSEFAKSAINDETPEQFFFQQLLADIISTISARIAKYAWHTKGHTKVMTDDNREMNVLFVNWMKRIGTGNTLRIYTLNYDRNFKIILEKLHENLSIFEGFTTNNTLDYGSRLIADVPKILTDTDSHVFYNLHGSAFWGVAARDANQLPNPAFYLTEAPVLLSNSYELPIWQSEKGKTLLLTNIITGLQKTQRAIFPPFKQMQSAFDRDCCFADTIYIVGYSFGDEHINASIKTAVLFNPSAKFIIVDPSFTKNDFDLNVVIKIFSLTGRSEEMKATTVGENLHSFFGGKFMVHTKTFKQYLESNEGDQSAE